MDQVPRGIPNLGQTCYAASALQCLRSLSMDGPWNHVSSVSNLVKKTTDPGDAHEFLMDILERWKWSHLVNGTCIIRILCTRCKTAKLSKEPFVFIKNTKDPPETIEGYECQVCKTSLNRARRASRFWKLCPVIVGLGPTFANVQSFETKDLHGRYTYERKGFVVYIPSKMHYVAIVRRGTSWFLCDDASVKRISGNFSGSLQATMTLYETGDLMLMRKNLVDNGK